MKAIEAAYIAGLIDGEGSICLTKCHSNTRRSPTVSFPNTSEALVQLFQTYCGGTIIRKRAYKANHNVSWTCNIRYDAALRLLTELLPYLRHPEKIRRARLLLAQYKSVTPRNGKYTDALNKARVKFEHQFFHPDKP